MLSEKRVGGRRASVAQEPTLCCWRFLGEARTLVAAVRDSPMQRVAKQQKHEEDSFRRWWDADFSWAGLRRKGRIVDSQPVTLQEYWADQKDDLVDFGGRKWTRFHLPLFDLEGEPSEKARWRSDERERFLNDILYRLRVGVSDYRGFDGQYDEEEENALPRARLQGVVFPAIFGISKTTVAADFRFARFERSVRFADCSFLAGTDFSDANLAKGGEFKSCHFARLAKFRRCSFAGALSFSGSRFDRQSDFTESEFRGGASFVRVRFGGASDYSDSEFGDRVSFERALFRTDASFRNCSFSGDVIFRHTTFGDLATFSASVGALFPELVDFSHAQFAQAAIFSGREFRRQTLFSGARFGAAPHFQGATLHTDTSFSGSIFASQSGTPDLDSWRRALSRPHTNRLKDRFAVAYRRRVVAARKWLPKSLRRWHFDQWLPGFKQVRTSRNQATEELESAYRTLRRLTGDNGNHEHEGMFYALEMNARRNRSDVRLFERQLALLFSWTSGYGQDALRPFTWWLFLLTVATSTICETLLRNLPRPDIPPFREVLRFTFRQFIPPPTVWSERELSAAAEAHPWVKWLVTHCAFPLELGGTLSAIATVSLIAVFFVTVRRRFALK